MEFAAVAPTFVFFLAICFDFARLSLSRSVAQNACYEAARFAMTEGVTRDEAIDAVEAHLRKFGFEASEILVNDEGKWEDTENPDTRTELDSNTPEVHVAVTIPMTNAALLLPDAWFEGKEISSEMKLKSERYTGYFDGSTALGNQ